MRNQVKSEAPEEEAGSMVKSIARNKSRQLRGLGPDFRQLFVIPTFSNFIPQTFRQRRFVTISSYFADLKVWTPLLPFLPWEMN